MYKSIEGFRQTGNDKRNENLKQDLSRRNKINLDVHSFLVSSKTILKFCCSLDICT